MKIKKLLVFISALVLVFGLNASSVLAATGVWTIDGIQDYNDSTNADSTNTVAYFNSDASNYCYTVWSKDGTETGAQISQTVEITEAGTYVFSFQYMGGPSSNGPIYVTGFVGDNIGTTENTESSGWIEDPEMWDWYNMEVELEAGTYEVGVVVDVTAVNAWGDVDNFTLTDADGNEYLVMGDFGFDDSGWTTYVTSNVLNGETAVNDAVSMNAATGNTGDDVEDDTDESGVSPVVIVVIVVVVIVVVAAIVVASKKKKQ